MQADPSLGSCPPGAEANWQEIQPFFASYCHRCHHSAIQGPQRGGAPIQSNFDTAELVDQALTRIYWRSAHDRHSMPPSPPSPNAAEREKLGQYLSCRFEALQRDAQDPQRPKAQETRPHSIQDGSRETNVEANTP